MSFSELFRLFILEKNSENEIGNEEHDREIVSLVINLCYKC